MKEKIELSNRIHNLKDEIIKQVKKDKFKGKFLTFIPDIKVYQ